MKRRIYGIETEYGLLIKEEDFKYGPIDVAVRVKNHIFDKKQGVLDLHYRANDEPPGNGGFLVNGGRVYLDMGHLEYASPECSNLTDLVTFDRAGDMVVQEALEDLGWSDQVAFIKNNVDLETNATFGCHENYLVSRAFQFDNRENLRLLASFLVTRQIYAGAGRTGACNPQPFRDWDDIHQAKKDTEEVNFQLSQRADHIPNEFYRWVQYNRAIVNTRDEPLSDPSKYRRIHLLVGDSNMSEFATALKMGTTSLIMELIELGVANPDWILADSVAAMRSISRDQDFKWDIQMRDGNQSTALELQREMWKAAKEHLAGKSADADWVIEAWGSVLDDLPKGPEHLIGRVDWAAKYWLLTEFMETENLGWKDPWVKSLDLEFHNLNRNVGLYWGLEETGDANRKTTDAAIEHAKHNPPRGTRADGRGELVKRLVESQTGYLIDWIGFRLNKEEPFLMLDPFVSYKKDIKEYLERMDLQQPFDRDSFFR
ncbi:proteasome accessory factor PafA2 family protein [Nitrospina watsonii]|uniref:Pup--protein ligase n=1 Tax=Nitrospina watsonii TaxID=1323948 RepID=A0ABM9HHC1_9BACT|nr:proteasome accessory factor PafA2 family protein [Nitrospina watsonii]CAI2719659.1 putative Pup--protein ligase [Nitrospina watsonii]